MPSVTPKIKQVAVAIAKRINAIPLVTALRKANRKIKNVIAFSLFRKKRFLFAAVARYWVGIISSLLLFFWAWGKFVHDPSMIVRYGKILTLFFPVAYEAMKVFSRVEYYQSRKERKAAPEWMRSAMYDEKSSHLPDLRVRHLVPFFGSFVLVLFAIWFAS
jgi:uncharacterized membrane protein YgcG